MKNKILSFALLLILLAPATSLAACVDLKNNLGLGSIDKKTKGEVTKLQTFLKSRVNGIYDLNTAVAVMEFRKRNNLPKKTGVDKKIREIIKNRTCSIGPLTDNVVIVDNQSNQNLGSVIVSTSDVVIMGGDTIITATSSATSTNQNNYITIGVTTNPGTTGINFEVTE